MTAFNLHIVTPEKEIFSGEVSSLVVPGEIGYLGVLANHAALVTNLIPGEITIKNISGKPTTLSSKGKGFLEILKNKATLLLDSVG
jgi:F-type H+-transporting ATPase subunit epsilon